MSLSSTQSSAFGRRTRRLGSAVAIEQRTSTDDTGDNEDIENRGGGSYHNCADRCGCGGHRWDGSRDPSARRNRWSSSLGHGVPFDVGGHTNKNAFPDTKIPDLNNSSTNNLTGH
jgi:hypothetical protein